MSFLAAIAQSLRFKFPTISYRSRCALRHASLLLAGLFITYISIAAPTKAAAGGNSASISQIAFIGKRMNPEQKRLPLEAEQRAGKAAADAPAQTQVSRKR